VTGARALDCAMMPDLVPVADFCWVISWSGGVLLRAGGAVHVQIKTCRPEESPCRGPGTNQGKGAQQ
jgi:hypothetical protein